ncbi:hypothetical protein FH972_023486 [Carpinus fangiana]|uniref:Spindle pole body-associated protein cut12 domain-containing protein n=1 Tax=Carpinus fangiana TaxID=176857 RepID=A0A5N6KVU4_9ROSI|nr:hypothetical protein FH972_023486 [Carpinus fangiana]
MALSAISSTLYPSIIMVLDWLSGGGPPTPRGQGDDNLFLRMYNGNLHHDASADILDPPETPAHLFPLRAFRQVLFGTPKLIESAPEPPARIESARDRSVHKTAATVPRRRSAEHIQTQVVKDDDPSPVKRPGILLTPGTGGQRRKTVTFGDRRSSVPLDTSDDTQDEDRTKFQQALLDRRGADVHQVALGIQGASSNTSQDDMTLDVAAPRSTSGRYWKNEYESFSKKSAAELRKLLKKEQIAKKYAKHKDSEARELAQDLQNESRKVAQLEAQVKDFVAKLSRATSGIAGSNRDSAKNCNCTQTGTHDLKAQVDRLQDHNNTLSAELAQLKKENEAYRKSINKPSDTLQCGQKGGLEPLRRPTCATQQSPYSENLITLSNCPTVSRQPGSSRGTPGRQKFDPPSDIWADSSVIGRDRSTGDPRKESTSLPRKNPRSPLQPRTANREALRVQPKSSTLSSDRREAARRRLEEKRRARSGGIVPP